MITNKAKGELQAWVKTELTERQQKEVSKLVAAYVVEAIRNYKETLPEQRSIFEMIFGKD